MNLLQRTFNLTKMIGSQGNEEINLLKVIIAC